VRRDICRGHNEDPLYSLFHELGHVAAHLEFVADRERRYDDLWEQIAHRFAGLLMALWHAENGEVPCSTK